MLTLLAVSLSLAWLGQGPGLPPADAGRAASRPVVIPNLDDKNADGVPDGRQDGPFDPADTAQFARLALPEAARVAGVDSVAVEVLAPWKDHARVLVEEAGALRVHDPNKERVPARALAAGAGFRLEARDFADRDRARIVRLAVRGYSAAGTPVAEAAIEAEVASFCLASNLDPVSLVYVFRTDATREFVERLQPLVEEAGAKLEVVSGSDLPAQDIWIQDAVEIGWAAGERALPVAIRGNRGRKLDEEFARRFLGPGRGVVERGRFRGRSAEWIDWFGNLEVSPPVKAGERDYPLGRFYCGTQGERAMHPDVVAFLEAQGAQGPVLWLDTSWLLIGHVDEIVSWVPAKDTKNPWRMLLPSPRLALELLRKAERDAPGGILNRGTNRPGDRGPASERPVAAALADEAFVREQQEYQQKIDDVREVLKKELGVKDEGIVELPVLFHAGGGPRGARAGAETPNLVNGLVIGRTLIVPDPKAPIVGGKDVFLEWTRAKLEPLGCAVRAIDDFYPYHRWGGEVHCGTNALRRPPAASK